MLIEVRSSETDLNNSPNHIFQRFKETLILKPNSKISLVSALTTTFKNDAYIISDENNTIDVKIAQLPARTVTLTNGNYTGDGLATELQTKIRNLGVKQDHKALFYPDTGILVTKSQTDGFHLQIAYEPVGFVSPVIDPVSASSKNTGVVVSNCALLMGAQFTTERPILRTRTSNAGAYSFSAGAVASNPILPYAQVSANKNYTGMATIGTFVKSNRPLQFGLQSTGGTKDIRNIMMDAIQQYTGNLGSIVTHYWDKFTTADVPTGETNYRFDYIIRSLAVGGFVSTLYAKHDDVYDNQLNVVATYADPEGGTASPLNISLNADRTAGENYSYDLDIYTPSGDSAGDTIPIAGQAEYAMLTNRDTGVIEIKYGGTTLNPTTKTTMDNGDSIRWVVQALDDSPNGLHKPLPQLKKFGQTEFKEIPIDANQVMPSYSKTSSLTPIVNIDGKLEAGAIGTGRADEETATSFLASDMTISARSHTTGWEPGEPVYQVGLTTPGGGLGMVLMAVVGTSTIGGATGNITGVLVIGNGQDGDNYANGMTFQIRGALSQNTATITINAVKKVGFTKTASGTGYTDGPATLEFNAGGSVLQPPYPFYQGGRTGINIPEPADCIVTQNAGAISTIKIVNGGFGFCIGDTVEVIQAGSDNAGRYTIQQVAEDLQLTSLSFDTKLINQPLGGIWLPMEPQNIGIIDTLNNGTSTLGTELLLRPRVYTGDLSITDQINSSKNPPFNNNTNENIMVNLVNIPINSRNAVGNTDNHIATIPYTIDLNNPTENSKQHYEPYNMISHSLLNEANLNLNFIELTLTDFQGKLRTDLVHPTQITLSITPDSK